MKLNISLSSMNEEQFEKELVAIGFKKTDDSTHKESGAVKRYFEGPAGAEVFIMHNQGNDFVRVAYKKSKDADTEYSQGSMTDFEKFFNEIKAAVGKGKN